MTKEAVAHPSHYNTGKIEVMVFIKDQKLGFETGNAVKYICRAKHKGKYVEDLKKAIFYLQYEVDSCEVVTYSDPIVEMKTGKPDPVLEVPVPPLEP